jgi:predicted SprT family Zn-dependent metalloprotease
MLNVTCESARLEDRQALIEEAGEVLAKHGYRITFPIWCQEGTRGMRRVAANAKWEGIEDDNEIELTRIWITFSPFFLDVADDAEFKEVAIHELAHVWFFEQGDLFENHGAKFQRVARQVGFSMHCEHFVPFRYIVYCPKCGRKWGRHRKCKLVIYHSAYRCPGCHTRLKLEDHEI